MRITALNIHGVMYGSPYLCDNILLKNDIVVITEHRLLPEQMSFLETLDNDFYVTSSVDERIEIEPENRHCIAGYGGVAILHRKSLKCKHISSIGNDRVKCVMYRSGEINIYIIGVLMPSTNLSVGVYKQTLDILGAACDSVSDSG